jgi:Family of unknown function (DUF6152)
MPAHTRAQRTIWIALAIAVTAWTNAPGAHHAIASIYDSSKPVRLEGVVTDFQFVSPHPFVVIETQTGSAAGRWRLDMDNRGELAAIGMTAQTFRKGDRIVATGGPARDGSRSVYVRRLDRPADGYWYEQVGSRPRAGTVPAR